jgi:hypothetical protein
MRLSIDLLLLTALCRLKFAQGNVEGSDQLDPSSFFSAKGKVPCSDNSVVASWCGGSSRREVSCLMQPGLDMYACQCEFDPSACPDDCIDETSTGPVKNRHSIVCRGIPEDEPNFILKNENLSKLPLHHCENNALVANWCNEATVSGVDCLLLPALDEYVCTCLSNAAACPDECLGDRLADRKTNHAIRCRGIPEDTPNYIFG